MNTLPKAKQYRYHYEQSARNMNRNGQRQSHESNVQTVVVGGSLLVMINGFLSIETQKWAKT